METPFAQLISNTGCYADRAGRSYIQSDAQSYIASSVHAVDTARSSVIRATLIATKFDRALRAKVECFLYRALTPAQWQRVNRTGIDKAVRDYVNMVRAHANSHLSVISASIKHHEKEL